MKFICESATVTTKRMRESLTTKRLAVFSLLLVLIVSLTACSQSQESPEASGEPMDLKRQEIILEDGIPYSIDKQGNLIQLGEAALVILDYITGVCAAIHSRELSSEIGAKGIAKKITTFAVISLAHILDEYVLKDGGAIQTMTSIFYIVNESISILENAIRTGLPVPEKLKSIIRSLGKSEESSEISDEKEEK